MSVLIKNMEMPRYCYECKVWSQCFDEKPPFNMIKSVCPLVEVKEPHGNLIDIDQMVNDFWDGNSMMIGEHELEQIKTVVEAE